jgi:hypothetical protein
MSQIGLHVLLAWFNLEPQPCSLHRKVRLGSANGNSALHQPLSRKIEYNCRPHTICANPTGPLTGCAAAPPPTLQGPALRICRT